MQLYAKNYWFIFMTICCTEVTNVFYVFFLTTFFNVFNVFNSGTFFTSDMFYM